MTPNKARVQAGARRLLDPVARLLQRLKISPDALTVTGLLLSIVAGLLAAQGRLAWAALLLLAGGLCDVLDGSLARLGGRASRHGAFLDSTLDRLAEIAVFLGLAAFYRERPGMLLTTGLALTGSLMTSYARARAEGLGVECKVGLLERPERLALLILGLLAAPLRIAGAGMLDIVIVLLAALSYFTTLQRIVHVIRRSAQAGGGASAAEGRGRPPGA